MLSKKFKAQLKKIATSTLLAISTVIVLFGMGANLDGIVNTVKEQISRINANEIKAETETDIAKDSNGVRINVKANDNSGVRKIEVLQEGTSVGMYNFSGSNQSEEQSVTLSIPFGETKTITTKVNGNTVKEETVTNMRCISTAQDLVNFRNLVNAGNTFKNQYVELINDIDLSSVCSATNGNWNPIGSQYSTTPTIYFGGTFNGNYYKIKNLYYNAGNYGFYGFFGNVQGGVVENTIFDNLYITSTYSHKDSTGCAVGGIAGFTQNSKIINCGVNGGTVSQINPYTATIGTNAWVDEYVGGIVGWEAGGCTISGCYNKANITAKNKNASYRQVIAGGVVGYMTSCSINNVYNRGTVYGESVNIFVGGVIGRMLGEETATNMYSTGTVSNGSGSHINIAGVCGGNSWVDNKLSTYSNAYCLTNVSVAYWYYTGGYKSSTTGKVSEATLKGYASTLGSNAWVADSYGINNGYPILRWQVPQMELNVKQAYMNVGETLQLSVDTSKSPVALGNITWASYDTGIAQIDSTGKVTAVGEGYTTVYATESTYSLKAMAIINVAKNGAVTFAQLGTAEIDPDGNSVVLKEDGTVWTTGSNNFGQLGNGTTLSSLEPVQVRTTDGKYLTDVVKIGVGRFHTLALTKDGYVYAWGKNSNGQAGVNSTDNQPYARKVVGVNGEGYLNNIVDVQAGLNFSIALGSDGTVYTWGNNANGELGIGNTANKTIPQIALCDKSVSVKNGWGECIGILQNGTIVTWGYGPTGALGNGGTTSTSIPQTINSANIVEVSAGAQYTIAKDISGNVYSTGTNLEGRAGRGQTEAQNAMYTTFGAMTLPSAVTSSNKVRYVHALGDNTVLLLQDGTIWTCGDNTYGQISIGTKSGNDVATFTQAKNSNGTNITNARNIGYGSAAGNATYLQTLDYVDSNGYVYTVGDNTFGQYGNGTTTSASYYTKMGIPYLNYKKDDIVIGVSDSYTISRNDFEIDEFNVSIDYNPRSAGTLTYSTTDTNISVDSTTGKVTGIEEGYARVKVTDTTNNIETYIVVKVVNANGEQLELGNKFTVSLTTSGEVWTWGDNTYGELGLDLLSAYEDKPLQVDSLNNIVDIGAGSYHAVAVNGSGEVYTWGLNNCGQLGNGSTTNEKAPIKINGLSNIVKVDAYKNITLALDSSGNLYAWGEGYSKEPKLIYENILDMSENAIITSERRVKLLDGTDIYGIRNAIKVSANNGTILVVLDNGTVKSIDTGLNVTTLSVTNGIDVSCGNGFAYILDKEKKLYTYGTNANGELGNSNNTTVNAPTAVSVNNVEIISAGESGHGAVATFDGSIYTTGLNDKGQLGHGDIDNKNVFEVVLNVGIESNVDKVVEAVGESEIVDIGLGITLNLKTDLAANSTSTISIVDDTIASLTRNGNGTYTVTGKTIGRTFLNATITGEINGEQKEFATNVEVRIVPEGGITIPQIKSGEDFSIALKSNGEVEAWGKNTYGQLGIGNNENYDEPQLLENLEETIVEIAVGNNHVLALTEDGNIYGWGLNDKGQVGNGTNANQLAKATVINIYGNELSKIIRVEAHGDNSFAINEDGEVYAWGKDFGSKATKLTDLENVIDVSTSYFVKADGTAYRMANLEKLTIVGQVRAMDEGYDHSVFLTTEGKAYGIGSNDYGQLGNGSTDIAANAVVAIRKDENNLLENITQIEAGDRYTLILTSDGSVYTSGLNENGKLGTDLETISVVTPIKNNNISNAMIISAGNDHAVVAKTDGSVYSWGKGNVGQLGNRLTKDSIIPVMVGQYIIRMDKKNIVLGKTDTEIVKAKVNYFNILKEDIIDINSISKNTQVARIRKLNDNDASLTEDEIAKGYKAFEIEGVKAGTTNIVLTEQETNSNGIIQIEVLPESGIIISPMVETVSNHTVTLKTNGTVWTYGQNEYGQLGTGDTANYDEPKQVEFPEGTVIKQIAVGEYHSVALDTEGNVWTWGRNNYYQLGNTGSDSNTPVMVTGIPKVTHIASGTNSVMCVTENNKLIAWGQNAYGELGIGQNINKITPTIINGVHDVLDVQGGKNHYLVLKTTGELFTVGSNLYGQLGLDLGERTRINTFENIPSNLKYGSISTGWSSNVAITIDGTAYCWGQNTFGNLGNGTKDNITSLTQVSGINGVVEADVGKTHTILRDYNQEVYLAGTNANGQLGDGTKDNNFSFTKNLNIDDVLRVAAGNTYTAVMKKDGTVWAWGDYNHGSKVLKSRTNSKVPVQIGSDTSSLDKLELVIKKSEVESILANSEYRFNLIYEDENSTSDFSYECLNTEIAEVNQDGNVLGIREGTTWVKVTDNETGKVNVAIIRVIDNVEGYSVYASPKAVTGEDFVAVLKEDGNIDIWGYDDSQMVDSDTPYTINVVATYVDLVAGKNHIMALRNDGTVWTAGDNTFGQLGKTNTSLNTKLVQVQDLTNVEKIAAGDNFCVAMDSFGLTYVWGEGFGNSPEILDTNIRSASYIAAGSTDQIVMVLPTGEVYGIGSILNGTIKNFDKAVKVEVGDDYLLILDTTGSVYTYRSGVLSKANTINNAIDISVKDDVCMYQKVNEKVYVWGENGEGQLGLDNRTNPSIPTQPENNSENVYTIAAGRNNTYIVDTDGYVYASGANNLGQIGNGTKEDLTASSYQRTLTHTIVGVRDFDVEPLSSIMEVNDVEELNIVGNTYNVFKRENTKDIDEYNVTVADNTVIELQEENSELTGEIKALTEGLTTINIEDKVTGKTVTATRKVVPMNQNRILSIMADGNTAEAQTPSDLTKYIFGYTVDVPMDDDEERVTLVIEAKDSNDVISIDEGLNYTNTNKLNTTVTIPVGQDSITIPVTIKASNGTEFEYELVINRVSNNNAVSSVTVNGYSAIASLTEEDVYEIVITDQGDNTIVVTSDDPDAQVSIRGKISELGSQSLEVGVPSGKVEVPFKVISESGKAQNYTLRIYTKEELLKLRTVKVNNENATLEDNGDYTKIIADDVLRNSVYVKTKYDTAYVGINESEKEVSEITKTYITTLDENNGTIEVEATAIIDGTLQTISKTYNLTIYKNRTFTFIDSVKVKGEIIEEENNTFIAYVLSSVDEANIEITAKESNYKITFENNEANGNILVIKELPNEENTFTFKVENDQGESKVYTLKIVRGSTDTRIKKITVGEGTYVVEASKTDETINGKEVYEARVLSSHINVDVTVQTANKYSKIEINNSGTLTAKIATENMNLSNRITEVQITIKSADEATTKEYCLRIVRIEDDVSLYRLSINELLIEDDIVATLENENDDTRYEVYLQNPVSQIQVDAITSGTFASVNINNEGDTVQRATILLDLTESVTEIPIKVTSEFGTIKTYYLTIHTISDDTSIESITVDGNEVTWNSILGRYEIKVDRNLPNYIVALTSTNPDAKVTINGTEALNTVTKQVSNEGDITFVNLKVTAANGITSIAKKLAIIEKSDNVEQGYVKVNGNYIVKDDQGNYSVEVVSTVESVLIEVGPQDANASVRLDDETQEKVWKGTKVLQTDREVYDVYIVAEDGVTISEPFHITIIRLDGNTDIDSIQVTYTKGGTDTTVAPEKREDGTYFLELPKLDEDRVALRITLEVGTSTVNVLGTEGKGSIYGYVNLTGEVTNVPIVVIAEDGTRYETTLVLEKQSNDTSLKQLTAKGYTITQTNSGYVITVDSKLDKLNITAIPRKVNAKVKLSTESTYSNKLEDYEVSILGKDEILFNVLAEDGETTGLHSMQILRSYDTSLTGVTVNGDIVTLGDVVNIIDDSTGNIVITAKNSDAEIYLLKDNIEIATGIGTLSSSQTLQEENESTYVIKVKGPGDYSNYVSEYTLKLRKKSTDNSGIIYLDGNVLTKNDETGKYEAVVIGANHSISVEKTSNYSTVKIDGNTTNIKDISVGPKTTTTYTVTITAEDGTSADYIVEVYRKNNDTDIKEVKVKLTSDGDEVVLNALANGSYTYKVPRNQASVFVTLETKDEKAIAQVNSYQALNIITKEVTIDSSAEITNVPLKVIAEDGTEAVVNLKLERESNDATLKELKYNNSVITQDENEEYTIEVDNRLTNIEIDATPNHAYAKLKVVGEDTYLSTLVKQNVDIDGKDYFEIEVIAEDGETTKVYKVNINRIFSTKISKVEVDGNTILPSGINYKEFVNATAENHTIRITPDNEFAVVTIYDELDNILQSGIGTISLEDSLLDNSKLYKVKVQGPAGFEEFEANYTITLTKNSQDTSAQVFVNDVEITKDEDSGKYKVITKQSSNIVKLIANCDYASVSIDGRPAKIKTAEQAYVINVREVKEITATIISQNGEEEIYSIEITRLDNNVNITSITVNDTPANKVTDTIYRSALAPSVNQAHIVITPEYECSTVTAEVDESAVSIVGELELDVDLPGSGTKEVTITITAQDGTRKTYKLNIVQNASDNLELTVKVNELEADKLDDSSYRIFVENTLSEVNVNLKAEDEFTTISSGTNTGNDITFIQTLDTQSDVTIVYFTVTTELGTEKDYMLYIIKESNDNSIQKLYVNGIEITKADNGRYITYVENTVGDPTVKVRTNNEYAYVRIGANERELQESTKVVKLADSRTTTVPIMVYSQSGVLNTEYLDIITTFAVGNIDSLIVDDVEVTNYNEQTKTFIAMVENNVNIHEIQVLADNSYVTLELADDVGLGSVTTEFEFEDGEEIREFTLFVTGETDLTQRYTIIVAQKSNNVELSQVKVNDVTLQEEFGYVYTKNIDLGAKKVKIEVTAQYPYATVKVGDTEVKTGASGVVWLDIEVTQDEITVPVVVTAADGTTIRTYNIILTRKPSIIKGSIVTDNWEDIHIANIYVYRTSDKRAIDDEENPRELVYYTRSKEDGSYALELPNADNYDVVFKKLGYLDTVITNVTAEAYSTVWNQTIKMNAGDIDENGEIELDDLVEFNEHIGEVLGENNKLYDLNEDKVIDSKDRDLIKNNYHNKKNIMVWINAKTVDFVKPLNEGYVVTSEYGYRVDPFDGSTKFHSGIDLAGVHHGNIYAVANGEVTFAGVQSGYGNCVEIKHIVNGVTVYSFYAHMSQIDVTVGSIVVQGSVIGLEGGDITDPNPGTSTGHHLHFELRSASGSGYSINPRDYIEL